jgi:hypothetical protein
MNVQRDSPAAYAVAQSDTTIFEPALYGVDVFAPGDLVIVNSVGDTLTVTFPAVADGGYYPVRWVVQIRQILGATSIADANLVALR